APPPAYRWPAPGPGWPPRGRAAPGPRPPEVWRAPPPSGRATPGWCPRRRPMPLGPPRGEGPGPPGPGSGPARRSARRRRRTLQPGERSWEPARLWRGGLAPITAAGVDAHPRPLPTVAVGVGERFVRWGRDPAATG